PPSTCPRTATAALSRAPPAFAARLGPPDVPTTGCARSTAAARAPPARTPSLRGSRCRSAAPRFPTSTPVCDTRASTANLQHAPARMPRSPTPPHPPSVPCESSLPLGFHRSEFRQGRPNSRRVAHRDDVGTVRIQILLRDRLHLRRAHGVHLGRIAVPIIRREAIPV